MSRGAASRQHVAREAAGPMLRPFQRSLPIRLMQAREALMQRFRPLLRSHGLTDQQWRIIRALVETEALEILQLGEHCVLSPASLSRILPKLAARGLLVRRPNAADQRRVIVSLTPKGRKLFATIAPFSEAIYAQITADIGEASLLELYRRLDDLLDRLAPGPCEDID